MSSHMNMTVDDRKVEWDDDRRELAKCQGCGTGTSGRATLDSPSRRFANFPYCMNCVMQETLSGEIAQVRA